MQQKTFVSSCVTLVPGALPALAKDICSLFDLRKAPNPCNPVDTAVDCLEVKQDVDGEEAGVTLLSIRFPLLHSKRMVPAYVDRYTVEIYYRSKTLSRIWKHSKLASNELLRLNSFKFFGARNSKDRKK